MNDQTDKTWIHWSVLIALKSGTVTHYVSLDVKQKEVHYNPYENFLQNFLKENKKLNLNIIMPLDLITSLQEIWSKEGRNTLNDTTRMK